MSTVRIVKTEKYSVIANQPINDKNLSWGARGMLAYLLSKPNNWQVRMTDLEKQSPAGEHATRTLVKELEAAGYMIRKRIKTEGGLFTWVTTVYETPQKPQNATIPQFSTDGLSTDGKVPDIVNTDPLNTDSLREDKKQSSRGKARDTRLDHPAIVGYRELAHLHIPITWRDRVIQTVGNVPCNIELWMHIVDDWIGMGWNKTNVKGMLEAYKNGGIRNGKAQHDAQRLPQGV